MAPVPRKVESGSHVGPKACPEGVSWHRQTGRPLEFLVDVCLESHEITSIRASNFGLVSDLSLRECSGRSPQFSEKMLPWCSFKSGYSSTFRGYNPFIRAITPFITIVAAHPVCSFNFCSFPLWVGCCCCLVDRTSSCPYWPSTTRMSNVLFWFLLFL